MTLDILPGTDGLERMSKSTGNYIGVTEDPRDIYGKVMSIPDETMPIYFRLLTSHHADELEEIERALRSGEVNPRDLKARLAREIIARLRGTEAAAEAEEHFERVFRRHEVATDLPTLEILAEDEENGSVYLPRVMERWFGVDALGRAAAHRPGRRLARRQDGREPRTARRTICAASTSRPASRRSSRAS